MLKLEKVKEHILKFFSLYLLVTLCLFLGNFSFTKTDFGIYDAYTRSIAKDFDLNIENQLYLENAPKLLTESNYFYSQHNYGTGLLIFPSYYYSQVIVKLNGIQKSVDENIYSLNQPKLKKDYYKQNTKQFFDAYTFAIFTCFLYILFSLKLFEHMRIRYEMTSNRIRNNLFFGLLISGPPLYYLMYEQSAPSLLTIIPLYLIFKFSKDIKVKENTIDNFWLGASFGLGLLIRNDFAFYGVFILLWWYQLRPNIKSLSLQAAGLATGALPFLVSNYVKVASLSNGYLATYDFNPVNILDTIISPFGGILLVHPIFAFIIGLLFIFSLKKRSENKELTCALIVLTLKLLALSLTYSHNGGVFGGRQLIAEYTLLSIFAVLLTRQVTVLVVPTIIMTFSNLKNSLIYGNRDLLRINFFSFDDNYISYYNRLKLNSILLRENFSALLNLQNFLYIVLISFGGVIILMTLRKYKIRMKAQYFLTYVIIIHSILVLNDSLKKFRVKNAITTNDINTLLFNENAGSLIERIHYLETRNRDKELEQTKRKLTNYYNNTKVTKDLKYLLIDANPYYLDLFSKMILESTSVPSKK